MRHGPRSGRDRQYSLVRWLQQYPTWDAKTKQDKLDDFITRIFPGFVVVFAVFGLVLFSTAWGNHTTLGHFLYSLAVSYAVGFIILGIPVMFMSEHMVVKNRIMAPVIFLLATAMGFVFWYGFGPSPNGINKFISGFYWFVTQSGLEMSLVSTLVGIYVMLMVCVFASYGVLAVIVAYFRKNYHRIFLATERNDDSKFCRYARKTFGIPSIIDVDEVVLDPETDDSRFHKTTFMRVFAYEIVAGLVVASYLFLNPMFLETVEYAEMMVIMMLLSLFVAAFVVPVSILRSLGAKALSAGNRPFELWRGMKERMFHPGFYVTLFLTMLWISLYSQMDGLRILTHYVGYLAFMFCLSAIVAFIYVNVFYVPFKNGIVRNFILKKREQE